LLDRLLPLDMICEQVARHGELAVGNAEMFAKELCEASDELRIGV